MFKNKVGVFVLWLADAVGHAVFLSGVYLI